MSLPAISVIIPCYNNHLYIEKAIKSILNQNYQGSIETIVVDDGSNEKTKVILKQNESTITKLITQTNKGQSTARNVGLKNASSDFIIFIDSDDFVQENFCKELIENYSEDFSVVTCNANIFINNKVVQVFKPIGGNIKDAILQNTALGTSLFVKQELLEVGGYDENMTKGFEDWELLIRLLDHTKKKVKVVDSPLYYYRKGIPSTTIKANKIKYDLLKYIYNKHKNIYKLYFTDFISYLLEKIKNEENEKLKMYSKIEYKTGFTLLKPLRFFKKIING